ncbi:MAG: hypothetical protein N2110_01470 [Flavobacteriales bacterium]|nr:hypothetical protein [Flavobacteriales bacterium]
MTTPSRFYPLLKSCKGGCVDEENTAILLDGVVPHNCILQIMNPIKIFSNGSLDELFCFNFLTLEQKALFCPANFEIVKVETALFHPK